MSELEELQNEISTLENQIEEKKRTVLEIKYGQRAIFAQRLGEARKKYGWTQEQIAKKLQLTRAGYVSYEIARNEPSIKTLIGLAEILNVSLDWLCGRTEKI